MRRLLILSFTLLVIPSSFVGGISISTDDLEDVTRCDQIHVTIDDEPALTAEEQLDGSGLKSLRVHAGPNGGVRVNGWDRGGYAITACKAARTPAALARLAVAMHGNEVSATGPDDERGVVFFLVRAPRNAVLDLDATNGQIAVRDVIGNVNAKSVNGPISIKQTTGTIRADAQNGPISFAGASGTVNLTAQNGPITLKLAGTSWDGTLDAHTQNGPVSLKLPRGYRSGVVVESDGHSPFRCSAEACRNASRAWNDNDRWARRVELGSGPAVVRVSTANGPVSVKDRMPTIR